MLRTEALQQLIAADRWRLDALRCASSAFCSFVKIVTVAIQRVWSQKQKRVRRLVLTGYRHSARVRLWCLVFSEYCCDYIISAALLVVSVGGSHTRSRNAVAMIPVVLARFGTCTLFKSGGLKREGGCCSYIPVVLCCCRCPQRLQHGEHIGNRRMVQLKDARSIQLSAIHTLYDMWGICNLVYTCSSSNTSFVAD